MKPMKTACQVPGKHALQPPVTPAKTGAHCGNRSRPAPACAGMTMWLGQFSCEWCAPRGLRIFHILGTMQPETFKR
jgi:hypothetical protein